MFYEMRRKNQAIPAEECRLILQRGSSGVLALAGDDGYPYAVPISYVYDGERLYFHSARSGHKLDVISANPKASFCVIVRDDILPERYTTLFSSVIVFGSIRILDGEDEKRAAIEKLALKYAPDDSKENRSKSIADEWNCFCMLEMTIEHMSGKESRELSVERKARSHGGEGE